MSILKIEIEILLFRLNHPDYASKVFKCLELDLNWTDAKIYLVELIYCIHAAKSVNGGGVSLKDLVKCFEQFFNIELHNYYDTFSDVVKREENRTKYLSILLNHLNKLLLEADTRKT